MVGAEHLVLIHGTWLLGDSWASARVEFEHRGYTVHTPTLRFHDLPFEEGASKVAPVSLTDYADDLVAYVQTLDSPPLLLGHSLGGLLAQLVAARTPHADLIAACTAPAAGIFALYPSTARIFLPHHLQRGPWANPLRPVSWKVFRSNIANTHDEQVARELYDQLVRNSGRVYWEMGLPWLDRAKAATVDFASIQSLALTIGGQLDRTVNPRVPRTPATRYRHGTYAEIEGSDHLIFVGDSLPITMSVIDDWLTENRLLPELGQISARTDERQANDPMSEASPARGDRSGHWLSRLCVVQDLIDGPIMCSTRRSPACSSTGSVERTLQ